MLQRLCCLVLPSYIVGTSFYVFLFGVSIGPNQTKMWLLGLFQTFLLDLFILTPMKIWVKWIVLAVVSADMVRSVHHVTKTKAKLILSRRKGLMSHANSFIQSLNPACRVARDYPHLGVARLLMSLNDFDMDKYKIPEKKLFAEVVGLIFLLMLMALSLLPEIAQDSILETTVTSMVNLGILGSYLAATYNFGLLAIPMGVIFILISITTYRARFGVGKQPPDIVEPKEQPSAAHLVPSIITHEDGPEQVIKPKNVVGDVQRGDVEEAPLKATVTDSRNMHQEAEDVHSMPKETSKKGDDEWRIMDADVDSDGEVVECEAGDSHVVLRHIKHKEGMTDQFARWMGRNEQKRSQIAEDVDDAPRSQARAKPTTHTPAPLNQRRVHLSDDRTKDWEGGKKTFFSNSHVFKHLFLCSNFRG